MGKHLRSSELKAFLSLLENYIAKNKPATAFIIIIENLPMLNSAYGHLGADEIISRLCDKISVGNSHIYRVSDNSIMLLQPGIDNKSNLARKKKP